MTAPALTKRDIEFFEEIRALMEKKYPEMEQKFGIWRIHQHFELGEDEVFYETSNNDKRESTLKIIKKQDLPKNASECQWRLSRSSPVDGADMSHDFVVQVHCAMD